MPRVLDPAQIETGAQRSIPRIRVPPPGDLYSGRAARLRHLSAGHALEAYLRLMAVLCDAQQAALARLAGAGSSVAAVDRAALDDRIRLAGEHGMPLLPAGELPLDPRWHAVLDELCVTVAEAEGFPAAVAETCRRLRASPPAQLAAQARLLLRDAQGAGADDDIDVQAAPLLMAALQCCWTQAVSGIEAGRLRAHAERFDVAGICPVCASLPVASIVRADPAHDGYRYLQCSLCATEWHLVRIKCSQCGATSGIHYHSVDTGEADTAAAPGGAPAQAVRAEACDQCHSYRKICYQAQDPAVEPLADDLASIALDLLMNEAGFERASGHPLLWQAG